MDNNENPPQNTGAQENYDGGGSGIQEGDVDSVLGMDRRPAVGGGSGKVIFFGLVMLTIVGFILYSLFVDKPPPVNPNNVTIAPRPSDLTAAPPPAASAPPTVMPTAPSTLPSPPPPPAPPPPPPPPPPPTARMPGMAPTASTGPGAVPPPPPPPPAPGAPPSAPDIKAFSPVGGGSDKEQQKRYRSNMLVLDGGAKKTANTAASAEAALDAGDANKAFASNAIKASKAEKATATRLNNLGITIAQGKIVNAVLETAINTDLPGTIRAIVSRDVYAESGREVMIPKGSRLLGTYNTGITRGQKRVLIVWTRLIRPDGLDIAIGSPGIDALGRAGVEGNVDNKYSEIFSTAILTSMISIGVAVAADAALGNEDSTTTQRTDGSSSTTGSSGAVASSAAVQNIGAVSRDIVNTMLDLRPTITIDQGTQIDVFVNKDMTFPSTLMDSRFVN